MSENSESGPAVTYDAIDGLMSDAQPMGTVNYDYDTVGRRAHMTYPPVGATPFIVGYTYNEDNSLSAETVKYSTGAAANYARFTYNNFAQVSKVTYGSGSPLPVQVAPTFDTSGRLWKLKDTLGNGDISNWTFAYNNSTGQMVSETQTGTPNYQYVAPVNIATYGINGLNQVTNRSGSTFTYDA